MYTCALSDDVEDLAIASSNASLSIRESCPRSVVSLVSRRGLCRSQSAQKRRDGVCAADAEARTGGWESLAKIVRR